MEGISNLDKRLIEAGTVDALDRIKTLSRMGPISLSEPGEFIAKSIGDYEARVASLLKHLVDPEPAVRRVRDKRSKLLSQIKRELRSERVLAKKDETLDSHRIVSSFELDEGLTADLALKNGAMHIIETVDASSDDEPVRKAIGEIGVAALVRSSQLEVALCTSPHRRWKRRQGRR